MEGLARSHSVANQVDTRLSYGLGLVCHVNALLVRCGTVQADRGGPSVPETADRRCGCVSRLVLGNAKENISTAAIQLFG
jgi:hypothetical protein